MVAEAVVADKADLGREVRQDTRGRRMEEEADIREGTRGRCAHGAPASYSLSPLAGPLVFANCLEETTSPGAVPATDNVAGVRFRRQTIVMQKCAGSP